MATRKNNLRFLTSSVLLEEGGLPKANGMMIISVFLMVLLFLVWSFLMEIDETVLLNAKVLMDPGEKAYTVQVVVPSDIVTNINVGNDVKLSMNGSASSSDLTGKIVAIQETPKQDEMGKIYYEALVRNRSLESFIKTNKFLYDGMTVQANVIVGKRTLFEYLVSPVLKAKENAFNEK